VEHVLFKERALSKQRRSIKIKTNERIKPIERTMPGENKVFKKRSVTPRTENQRGYIRAIVESDIVLCQGPAGSGKTHIAIGMATQFLERGDVDKIVVARPVLEAGEKIGFLPGDQNQKLDPYIRPIMDELAYYVSYADIAAMKNANTFEIVPIGYMRGRTFKNSFVIIDECQNATFDQIKMILSRLGESSRMVLTGDPLQSDLEKRHQGGFEFACELFKHHPEIACIKMESTDIVRHRLISSMMAMWENHVDKYKSGGIMR